MPAESGKLPAHIKRKYQTQVSLAGYYAERQSEREGERERVCVCVCERECVRECESVRERLPAWPVCLCLLVCTFKKMFVRAGMWVCGCAGGHACVCVLATNGIGVIVLTPVLALLYDNLV